MKLFVHQEASLDEENYWSWKSPK